MKYLEFTFHTTPCTEIVNDVLSAVLGETGFESFVEQRYEKYHSQALYERYFLYFNVIR